MRRLIVSVTLIAASCSPGGGTSAQSESISHIHGLGVGEGGEVYVATHYGLHVYAGGEWLRRSADRNDHMGFSLTPAGMWRSGHPASGGSLGVQESPDDGRRWTPLSDVARPPVDFHAMTATRDEPATLYGWDSGGRGLFRSGDGGRTWERTAAGGLPAAVGALAASRVADVVYATAQGSVFRSQDAASSWQKVSDKAMFALGAGGDPEVLYGGLPQGGVARSADGGTSWQVLDVDSGRVVAVATSPDGRTVLAADERAQVWRSTDGGETWATLPMP